MVGKTVGKYRIVDRLGRGGMGTVYHAIDETLDREVAIKVLNADLGDEDVLKRFRAEAVTLARLSHPGIATIYELHRQDDDLLMVMEFVRGETVHALSERLGPLAVPQVAHLCIQVLDALGYAHRAGIVHRDLKPANLMIAQSGIVKVMDFGIARMVGTEHFTQGGYMMGTPAYMAPEQVLGREVDGRSDLYAVGVVLYRLLAGELPFKADTSIAMVQKQISEPPRPITTFRPDLAPWCISIIDRALEKSPGDRFQSAEEFRAALAAAAKPEGLGELPTMATPSPPGFPIGAEIQREPTTRRMAGPALEMPDAEAGRSHDRTTSHGRTTTTVVLGRTHLVTLGALLAVLLAGIAVLAFLALRGSPTVPVSTVDVPAGGAKPETTAAAPPPVTPPAPPAAGSTPGTPATSTLPPPPRAIEKAPGPSEPAPRSPAASPSAVARESLEPKAVASDGSPKGEAGARGGERFGGRGLRGGRAADPDGPLARVPPVEPAAPLVVENVRLAQHDPGRGPARERDGVLRLGDGQLRVLDRGNQSAIVSVPYEAVLAAFISRSPQPRWRALDGSEVGGRVDMGGLGFLGKNKGDRNWLIVIARDQRPVVLRLSDEIVRTVVTEFNTRSGIPVQRFIPR